ncbi:unnamed protein product [Linum trigynum]|uniref:RNase H type-1 domain-containing protein n=1 Tax=Linum trigynum TaxID=586398 RepID=A0AAV2ESI5_9ROSI
MWKSLWRVPATQRIRAFFWLVAHQRLLANCERRRRHLTTVARCQICGGDEETTLHVIRDCPYARAAWADFLQEEPDESFFQDDLRRWILHYLAGRSRSVPPTRFAVMCWMLWKNRNKFVFEKELDSTSSLPCRVVTLEKHIEEAATKAAIVFNGEAIPSQRMIAWKPPPAGWSCLNTDGSVVGGNAAAGGVIRREDGRMLRAFSGNLGEGSITRAELARIAFGLKAAWEMGIRQVQVQTDSHAALRLVEGAGERHPHLALVSEVRRLLALDWQVEVIHVFREGNVVADYLASLGHGRPPGFHLVESHCPILNHWLLFDCMGVSTPRLVHND